MAVQETRSGRKVFPPLAYWLGEKVNSGSITFASSIVLNAKFDRHLIPDRIHNGLEKISPKLKKKITNESFTVSDNGVLKLFSNKQLNKSKRVAASNKKKSDKKNSKISNSNFINNPSTVDVKEQNKNSSSLDDKIKGQTFKRIKAKSKHINGNLSLLHEVSKGNGSKRNLPLNALGKRKKAVNCAPNYKPKTQTKSKLEPAIPHSSKSELCSDRASFDSLQVKSGRNKKAKYSVHNKSNQHLKHSSSEKVRTPNNAKIAEKSTKASCIKACLRERHDAKNINGSDEHNPQMDIPGNQSFNSIIGSTQGLCTDSEFQKGPLKITNRVLKGKRLFFTITDDLNKDYSGDVYEKVSKENQLPKSVINFLNETSTDEDVSLISTPKPSFCIVPSTSKIQTPLTNFPFRFPTPLSPNKRMRLCRSSGPKRMLIKREKTTIQEISISQMTTVSKLDKNADVNEKFGCLLNSWQLTERETKIREELESDCSIDEMNSSDI